MIRRDQLGPIRQVQGELEVDVCARCVADLDPARRGPNLNVGGIAKIKLEFLIHGYVAQGSLGEQDGRICARSEARHPTRRQGQTEMVRDIVPCPNPARCR